MNKKSILSFVLAALFVILGILLWFQFSLIGYAFLSGIIGILLFMVGMNQYLKNLSPERRYESAVKDILNTFDSILVKSNSIPNLENRNVIPVMSIDDLIDAQLEIRKPICYMKQTESCSFVLLDDKEAYIYIEKLNEDIVSPLEIAMKEAKIKQKGREEMDSEMLRDIERTTVVKLSNQKSYKVSPIRKKNKKVEILEEVETESIPEMVEQNEKSPKEILDELKKASSEPKVEELYDESSMNSEDSLIEIESLEEKSSDNNLVVEELEFVDEMVSKTKGLDEIEIL